MRVVVIVNAMGAGSGNLEVTVTCRGEEVPSTVTTGLHASDITVSFVPKSDETHLVNVYFNGQTVPGVLSLCSYDNSAIGPTATC